MPTDWGGRSQEDHQSLPLNAKLAGRPSATGCTQRTPRGVSVFPVGQVYPDGASICLASYRAMLGGRREAGFCWDRCLLPVPWLTSAQGGGPVFRRLIWKPPDFPPQGLATTCQRQHPWRASRGRRMGQGLSSTAHPAWMANSCSPATEPLVLNAVLEDTVQNQKHS